MLRSSPWVQGQRTADEQTLDSSRARALADDLDLTDVKAAFLLRDAHAVRAEFDKSRITESARLYRESIQTSEQAHDSEEAARTRNLLSWLLVGSGRLGEADVAIADQIRYCREVGARVPEQNGHSMRALLAILRDDLDLARDAAQEIPATLYTRELMQALIAEREGPAEIAAVHLPSVNSAGGEPRYMLQIHGIRGRALYYAGEHDPAREEFEAWGELVRPPTLGDVGPEGTSVLGAAGPGLAELADDETVRFVYDSIVAASTVRVVWSSGADELRGALALRLGLVDEAEQHYRTGIE